MHLMMPCADCAGFGFFGGNHFSDPAPVKGQECWACWGDGEVSTLCEICSKPAETQAWDMLVCETCAAQCAADEPESAL